jgi:hypothetical protein
MGFLVYELNCHYKPIWLVQIWKMLQFDCLKILELDCPMKNTLIITVHIIQ